MKAASAISRGRYIPAYTKVATLRCSGVETTGVRCLFFAALS